MKSRKLAPSKCDHSRATERDINTIYCPDCSIAVSINQMRLVVAYADRAERLGVLTKK